jgi:UDP-2,3-diacylglucosamine pyrophosphatase LpxH
MADDFNYLILSDLHLQEAEQDPAGRLFYFDEEFADLLRHYRLFSVDGRRWRLIIGGDLIEFLVIKRAPDADDRLLKGETFSATERRFFPGTEWPKSVWKLELILRSHPQLLLALARFIAAGHEIFILRGNHDLELFWPQVQEHFRLLIAEHHPVDASYQEIKAAARERIHFLPWFYLEPGLLYVEHGHQYDEYCSNAHHLYPILAQRPRQLELALSGFTMRYVAARIQKVDPAAMETMNRIPRYIKHLLLQDPSLAVRIPSYWIEATARILTKVKVADAEREAFLAGAEAEFREEIGRSVGLDGPTLEALTALGRPPLLDSFGRTLKGVFLDLLTASVASLALTATLVRRRRWWSAVAAGAAAGLVGASWKRRLSAVNDHGNLREIARTIHRLLGVRYVVFGHSHDPDVLPLDGTGERIYFNVGTWLPQGGESQMIYLHVLRDPERPTAHLMRWDRHQKQPVQVDAASYDRDLRDPLSGRPAPTRDAVPTVAS